MKRSIKISLAVLIAGLIVIQFFQPQRNKGEAFTEKDLVIQTGAPRQVAILLTTSCYDCHSNHTNYPWYSRFAPVSWFLGNHIRKGKTALNLSNWGTLEKQDKIGVLADLCDEVESGNMPLKSYLLMHGGAKLNDADVEMLCNWTELEALKILKE